MAEEKKKNIVLTFEDWLSKESGETEGGVNTDVSGEAGGVPTAKPEDAAPGSSTDAGPQSGSDDSDLMLLDEPEEQGSAPAGGTATAAPAAPAVPTA